MSSGVGDVARFLAVGLINTGIGLSCIYAAMYFWSIGPYIANAIGYIFGFLVSYHLNRIWTFRKRLAKKRAFFHYMALVGFAYLTNISIVYIGISHLGINIYIMQLVGVLIYTTLVYLGSSMYVFPQKAA